MFQVSIQALIAEVTLISPHGTTCTQRFKDYCWYRAAIIKMTIAVVSENVNTIEIGLKEKPKINNFELDK